MEKTDWFSYVPGKARWGADRCCCCCRRRPTSSLQPELPPCYSRLPVTRKIRCLFQTQAYFVWHPQPVCCTYTISTLPQSFLPHASPTIPAAASTKELLHSRAYLRFKEAADIPRFQAAWDSHVFVNERGTQFRFVAWVGGVWVSWKRALEAWGPGRAEGQACLASCTGRAGGCGRRGGVQRRGRAACVSRGAVHVPGCKTPHRPTLSHTHTAPARTVLCRAHQP